MMLYSARGDVRQPG